MVKKSILALALLICASQVQARMVTLRWGDTSSNEDGFTAERSCDGAAFSRLAPDTGPNVTTLAADQPLETICKYHVRAFNTAGVSAWSNEPIYDARTIPSAPSNLTITPEPVAAVTGAKVAVTALRERARVAKNKTAIAASTTAVNQLDRTLVLTVNATTALGE